MPITSTILSADFLKVNWERLRVFWTVTQSQNLSAAAKRLFLSQPSISRQIAALEESLGLPLFERYSKGLSLTGPGLHLKEALDVFQENLDACLRAIQEDAAKMEGDIVIAYSRSEGHTSFFQALGQIKKEHPHLSFQIKREEDATCHFSCTSTGLTLHPEAPPRARRVAQILKKVL